MGAGKLDRGRGSQPEDLQDDPPRELGILAPRLSCDVDVVERLTSTEDLSITKYSVQMALAALYPLGDLSGHGLELSYDQLGRLPCPLYDSTNLQCRRPSRLVSWLVN